MRIDYHRTLIADAVRNAAFHDALKALIVPGETVVADIGAGTGLLGLMASRLGAKAVFLYETAEVAGVASRILKANRARNCEIIACHSTDMIDPPKVDLVVSETLGNYAFEEDMIETLADAKRRFLKPAGQIVPRRVRQFVAPVVAPRIHEELSVWDRVGYGLDLSVAKVMSLNNAYVRTLATAELLPDAAGAPAAVQWDAVDLGIDARSARKGEAQWRLAQAATVYGFLAWWEAELAPGVMLSTAPAAPRTHWEQLYFPLLDPLPAKAGETVAVFLRSKTSREGGTHLAWTATLSDANGRQTARQALDLDKGYLP